ncbi:MAG: acyltransferase [Opitutaceae bacterium]|nr:acyltransferase [Cytophagales bacterium]
MKKLIEYVIRLRNPHFRFDVNVTGHLITELALNKGKAWLRGFTGLLSGIRGRQLMLGTGVRFFNARKIKLGKWVKIDDYCTLSALGTGELRIGNNSGIGAFSRIIISTSFNLLGSHIHIGNNVGIGEYAYLGGGGGLEIGDDCIVGQYFSCHPENHNYDTVVLPVRLQGVSRKGIKIGRDCWIGAKVTILDGVEIGDHCVIAAGAVVTKSMPACSVIGGVPAKVIKERTIEPVFNYQN